MKTWSVMKNQIPWLTKLPFLGDAGPSKNLSHEGLEDVSRHKATSALIRGTIAVTILFFGLLLVSYFLAGNKQVGARVVINGVAIGYLILCYAILRLRLFDAAAKMLLIFYVLIAALAVWQWGIQVSISILVMSIVITMAALLLGAKYALYMAATMTGIIVFVQYMISTGLHLPDTSWRTAGPSENGEAIGICLLFVILALITWLFGRQLEASLDQARQAESALSEEKRLLAIRLKERTESLQAAQLQEMQQLYRFAQLGQLSTALLHDLSNHLTSLTLDIDDIDRQQHAAAVQRARESIAYLDELVGNVKKQLHDKEEFTIFDSYGSLQTIAAQLLPRFVKHGASLSVHVSGPKDYRLLLGDAVRFGQIVTILLNNALDATIEPDVSSQNRRVRLSMNTTKEQVTVRIEDYGRGVTAIASRQLFKPFYTTKRSGMGIGLFITQQIVRSHFGGEVKLTKRQAPTTFDLVLPRKSTGD